MTADIAAPQGLKLIESRVQIEPAHLDGLVATHLIPADKLRSDDFLGYFTARRSID